MSYFLERVGNPSNQGKMDQTSQEMSQLDTSILNALRQSGPITRSQLVKVTGIPRSTVYDALFRLIIKGFVRKYSDRSVAVRGRPRVFFEASIPEQPAG